MTKKIVILFASALLVLASVNGCSRCRQTTCSWFNRGDGDLSAPRLPARHAAGNDDAAHDAPSPARTKIEIAPSM